MVNVGGRSKGCSTCRQRRVKCDETRPVCQRCQKGGLACEGPRETAFIQGTIVKSRRRMKEDQTEGGQTSTRRPDPPLNEIIAISPPSQVDVYICFSRRYLRRGAAIDLALQKMSPSELVASTNTRIFPQAILSFGSILFGTHHDQRAIVGRGYALYSVALRQLNKALAEEHCYTRDEVILTVATLAILESLVPTSPNSYLQHMLGLERLLELRGPRSFSPLSAVLFKSVRHMILFASLRTGKPSILARAEWKQALRETCSEEEMQEQDLFDILADCTVLANNESEALELLLFLDAWRQRWEGDGRNAYVEISHHGQTHFGFLNQPAAIMFMFYNTTLIYVLQILAASSTEGEYVSMQRAAALAVCRCLPYYQQTRRDDDSSPIVHWAATTAWTTLSRNECEERQWGEDLLFTSRDIVARGLWNSIKM
ncbi:hypothetical protein ASPZODRAFT_17397 [Penicilliopsis zonata CBS 506.65]|uniref:Zn(2)-C6 fungal-type domain-containing protein n=1 Tax=Penicilliopsis zonata CBS 506.65 TaxID=1073090 RepID=A0A1L9SFU1_9EURO|nr:hypothetical protein ASPZODRAFT_17397 [Penicilliopsis zonata CBS 506.65]OJJ45967.1 hypothetical protein ASPZODRAFT_17397 [Penicilliopsis zonata CBS 506.65]